MHREFGPNRPAGRAERMGDVRRLIVVLAGLLPACASGPPPVEIRTFSFRPPRVEVRVGDTVTWVNRDDTAHTVTGPDGFDSGPLVLGASYSHTFAAPGTFPYVCSIHDSMRGEVLAAGEGGNG